MDQIIFVQEAPRVASQLIEFTALRNGLNKIPFEDVPQLRNQDGQKIVIVGIRLVTEDVLTHGMTSGELNAPVAELQKMALVLYSEQWEKAQYIPLLFLNDMQGGAGSAIPHRYSGTTFDKWENVDWSKSFIELVNGQPTANTPYCVMFDVQYLRFDSKGVPIYGPR